MIESRRYIYIYIRTHAHNLTDPYYRGVTTLYQERSVVPTRNFTPRLSSLSTYLSRAIGDNRILNSKYASVHRVQTFEYLWKTHRSYSSIPVIGNDDSPSLSLSLYRRSIPITIQNSRPENLVSLSSSLHIFFLFFFFSIPNNAFPFTFGVYIARVPRIATVSVCPTEFLSLPSPSCLLVFYIL